MILQAQKDSGQWLALKEQHCLFLMVVAVAFSSIFMPFLFQFCTQFCFVLILVLFCVFFACWLGLSGKVIVVILKLWIHLSCMLDWCCSIKWITGMEIQKNLSILDSPCTHDRPRTHVFRCPKMTWCSIDNHTDNCEKLMSFPLSDHNHQADFFVAMVHAGYVCVSIIHWSLTWITWMGDHIMLDFACWQWAISLGSKFCADSIPHRSSLEETINWGPCDQQQKTLTLHQLLIILTWLRQCDQKTLCIPPW